jgi:hypothetical protein
MANNYQAVLLTQAAWGDFGRTDAEGFSEATAALNWLALQTAQAKKGRRVVLRAEIIRLEKGNQNHE